MTNQPLATVRGTLAASTLIPSTRACGAGYPVIALDVVRMCAEPISSPPDSAQSFSSLNRVVMCAEPLSRSDIEAAGEVDVTVGDIGIQVVHRNLTVTAQSPQAGRQVLDQTTPPSE